MIKKAIISLAIVSATVCSAMASNIQASKKNDHNSMNYTKSLPVSICSQSPYAIRMGYTLVVDGVWTEVRDIPIDLNHSCPTKHQNFNFGLLSAKAYWRFFTYVNGKQVQSAPISTSSMKECSPSSSDTSVVIYLPRDLKSVTISFLGKNGQGSSSCTSRLTFEPIS